jgi:signal transduction histidine kinase
MLADTARLSGLIDNILESSKADPKSMELQTSKVDLGKFLSEIVKDHKRQFEERKCKVKLQFEASPILTLDKKALQMVFNNLIGNALRYSPNESTLKITLHRSGRFWEIDFEDQGIGFEKKDMKKIFKKFYRVQNEDTQNIEGAGLGLYISREIIRNHKGKLKVMSPGRGKGSVFTVSLPVSRGLTV